MGNWHTDAPANSKFIKAAQAAWNGLNRRYQLTDWQVIGLGDAIGVRAVGWPIRAKANHYHTFAFERHVHKHSQTGRIYTRWTLTAIAKRPVTSDAVRFRFGQFIGGTTIKRYAGTTRPLVK